MLLIVGLAAMPLPQYQVNKLKSLKVANYTEKLG